jgi:hypothetical protein
MNVPAARRLARIPGGTRRVGHPEERAWPSGQVRLRTHPFAWELQLFVGAYLEVVQVQVCKSEDEVLTAGEQWKAPDAFEGGRLRG